MLVAGLGIYRMETLAFLFTLEQPHAGSLGKREENGPRWMLAFPVCLRWGGRGFRCVSLTVMAGASRRPVAETPVH